MNLCFDSKGIMFVRGRAAVSASAPATPDAIAPATALTHLATEPGVPDAVLRPFADLGLHILQAG